eukprot:1308367-Pyramimonas_sp.AAC.1
MPACWRRHSARLFGAVDWHRGRIGHVADIFHGAGSSAVVAAMTVRAPMFTIAFGFAQAAVAVSAPPPLSFPRRPPPAANGPVAA